MHGVFVGLATCDIIHHVPKLPVGNRKAASTGVRRFAGGAATNAAVTFTHGWNTSSTPLQRTNDDATLITRLAAGDPFTGIIERDLEQQHVSIQAFPSEVTPTASLAITGRNQSMLCEPHVTEGDPIDPRQLALPGHYDLMHCDGYYPEITAPVLLDAVSKGITTTFNGDTLTPGLIKILPYISVAVVSNRFANHMSEDVFQRLKTYGIEFIAVTDGHKGIEYRARGGKRGVVKPPRVKNPVDTIGAGDVFHGALAKLLAGVELTSEVFISALADASVIAALSTRYLGTRDILAAALPRTDKQGK